MVQAELPAGVVNLVFGTGPLCGEPLVVHPDVELVSFTGSTKIGARIAQVTAPQVIISRFSWKRVIKLF